MGVDLHYYLQNKARERDKEREKQRRKQDMNEYTNKDVLKDLEIIETGVNKMAEKGRLFDAIKNACHLMGENQVQSSEEKASNLYIP